MINTEQGRQFTSLEFTQVLQEHGVRISMDVKRRYQESIFVKRLWRAVKYEEVYLKAYASVLEAQWGLATTSSSTTDSGPTRAWATGLRPRCSTGSRIL